MSAVISQEIACTSTWPGDTVDGVKEGAGSEVRRRDKEGDKKRNHCRRGISNGRQRAEIVSL